MQSAPAQTLLIALPLPMSAFENNQTRKKTEKRKRKTKVTPKKGTMMTTKIADTRCERTHDLSAGEG